LIVMGSETELLAHEEVEMVMLRVSCMHPAEADTYERPDRKVF